MNPVQGMITRKRHLESHASKKEDDLSEQRKKIHRNADTPVPSLCNRVSKQDGVSNKSGVMWKAIDQEPDTYGGNRIRFKLEKRFDDITPSRGRLKRRDSIAEQIVKSFPAVEPHFGLLLGLDPTIDKDEWIPKLVGEKYEKELQGIFSSAQDAEDAQRAWIESNKKQVIEDFTTLDLWYRKMLMVRQFGYECHRTEEGVYLIIPDREALEARWNKIRQEHPELPELGILPQSGIADDRSFIKAFFSHHRVLSEDKEFIHDQIFHIISLLNLIVEPLFKQYILKKREKIAQFQQRIQHVMEQIENIPPAQAKEIKQHIELLEASLSAYMDVFNTNNTFDFSDIGMSDLLEVWENPLWVQYFKNRFGDTYIGGKKLKDLWGLLAEVEKNLTEV